MPSQWAVDMLQQIRLVCGGGAARNCKKCLKELEKIVLELDEERSNLNLDPKDNTSNML